MSGIVEEERNLKQVELFPRSFSADLGILQHMTIDPGANESGFLYISHKTKNKTKNMNT